MRHPTSALLVALACLALPAAGQTPTPPPQVALDLPPLRVAVTQVAEVRPTPAFSGLTLLSFSVAAEGLPADTTLRSISIIRAEDNLGTTIPAASVSSAPPAVRNVSLISTATRLGNMEGRAALGAVSRDAESLKFAEGLIEIAWQPASGSTEVKVDNLAARSGLIESPALAQYGIKVRVYSDQEGYERLCAELGWDTSPLPNFPQAAGFYILDPEYRFNTCYLVDESGKTIPSLPLSRGVFKSGAFVSLEFGRPLPAGASLMLILKAEPITKTVPFRVEDIPLP